MIGGGGEKKTLRLVALYADESNLICQPNEVTRKLDALAGHCDASRPGPLRNPRSLLASCCIAPTHDQAVAESRRLPGRQGDRRVFAESRPKPTRCVPR